MLPLLLQLFSRRQIPRLFQIFPTVALIFIKPPEVYRLLNKYFGTICNPSCACQLYLTVLRLCLFYDYHNCGNTSQANHNFADFSQTNVKFHNFSRFSIWVGTRQPATTTTTTVFCSTGLVLCSYARLHQVKVKGATYPYRGVGRVLISLP